MDSFRDYKYSLTQVTAITIDTTNSNYVWLAFSQSGGTCLLKKVSAYDLSQVYYTVTVPVSRINAMVVTNGLLFLAVTHATIFSLAYSVTNPLTTFTSINKPIGVEESPIAVTTDNSVYIYFLTPGTESETFANIVQVTNANIYNATIELLVSAHGINNAISITWDSSNNLWVVTDTLPVKLIRVYNSPSWEFNETILS